VTSLDSANPVSPVEDAQVVSVPPLELHLDPFYKKYLNDSGIPIISSEQVPDEAFFAVQKMTDEMLSMRSDVRAKMIENKIRIGIIAKSEVPTDMPEYRNLNDSFPDTDWDTRGRGYGANVDNPLSTCAEENVLCYGKGNDSYYPEDIFIHEFAHSIYALGISFIDTGINTELQQAFDNAITNGLWKDTYAATDKDEYFAEGVQDWYDVNDVSVPTNGIHNEIHTRDQLKDYDPTLYNILKRYFSDDNKKISCHQQ